MDADCLVKLTKAGAKEPVLSALEVSVPLAVKREVVDEGKASNYPDAFAVEDNLRKGRLTAVKAARRVTPGIALHGGEGEVLSLFLEGGYDAVASDDAKFLKRLEIMGVPFLTAAACVAYLYTSKRARKGATLGLLEQLRRHISREEYGIFRLLIEEGK